MMEFIKDNLGNGIIIILMILLFISSYYIVMFVKIIKNIENMVEEAFLGDFSESHYDETRLSRLESRLYGFLCNSELKKHQMEEERARIRELTGDISHQTKTPLANMRLYSQLLLEAQLTEEQAQLARQVEGQSKKLEFLIGNLVKVSRLESNLLQFQMGKYQVDDLFQLLKETYESQANKKEISLNIKKDPLLMLWCDKKWTMEALGNIVDNAIKYTQSGGIVEIWAKATSMFLVIYIKDNGKGIKEEELGKIFKRFYRSTESIQEEGVGIGLYLSRKIVGSQGGYIKVSSELEEGSVFQVGFKYM